MLQNNCEAKILQFLIIFQNVCMQENAINIKGQGAPILPYYVHSYNDSSFIQNSRVGQTFEDLQQHGLLLGDSGYALRPYLMTPVLNPRTPAEQAYNRFVLQETFQCIFVSKIKKKVNECMPF